MILFSEQPVLLSKLFAFAQKQTAVHLALSAAKQSSIKYIKINSKNNEEI